MKKKIYALQGYALARTVLVFLIAITAIYTISINYEPVQNLYAQEDSTGDSTDNPTEAPPVDVSGMFNERGYYSSNSVSYDENEIISDFNGNLMYSVPMFKFKGPGDLFLDLSLNYNGSVGYQVVAATPSQTTTQNTLPIYNISAPGWIFSVNGMAAQMLDFETHFFTKPDGYGDASDDQVKMLASGYHLTNQLKRVDASERDVLTIMMGDGSTVNLQRIHPSNTSCTDTTCYTGEYNTTSKKSYIRARVEYLDNQGPGDYRNRIVYLMKGDGLTYIYKEMKYEYADFLHNSGSLYHLRPQSLYLTEIIDRYGHKLNLEYMKPYGTSGYGRYLLSSIHSFFQPGVDGNWSGETSFFYDPFHGAIRVKNPLKGAYKIFCNSFSVDTVENHRTVVNSIVNPYNDELNFEYDGYERNRNDLTFYGNTPLNIKLSSTSLLRLKKVINYNGGIREYEYYDPSSSDLSMATSPGVFVKSDFYKGQGRDAFFTNMLSSKETQDVLENTIKTESFNYGYDNKGRAYQYIEAVDDTDIYSTKREITAGVQGNALSTPTSQGSVKYYKNFRLKPDRPMNGENPDWKGEVKIFRELSYTSDTNAAFKIIDYEFDKGTRSPGGGYSGSFLDTAITENIKGQIRKQSFRYTLNTTLPTDWAGDNPPVQKIEYDPLRKKTITDFTIYYKRIGFHPAGHFWAGGIANGYDSTYFYLLNLPNQIKTYDSTGALLQKVTNSYIDSLSNLGYMGQITSSKVYAQGSESTFLETQYKYNRGDTLGQSLYSSGYYVPTNEGLLKEVIDSKGNSTKYYYRPVKISEKDPKIFGPGTFFGGPRVQYLKAFENGQIDTLSETWFDIRMPVRIDSYNATDKYTSKFMKYNEAGQVIMSFDDNHMASNFQYDSLDRIKKVILPYDYDTLHVVDSVTYDTSYVPVDYKIYGTQWGNWDRATNTGGLYELSDVIDHFVVDKKHSGGPEGNPAGDKNILAIMEVEDTIFSNLDTIEYATLEFHPYNLEHHVNGNTSPSSYKLVVSSLKTLDGDENSVNISQAIGSSAYKYINAPFAAPNCQQATWRHIYQANYNIFDITNMLRSTLNDTARRFEGLTFDLLPDSYSDPSDTLKMSLSHCIQWIPSAWSERFAPVIKIKGIYKKITPRIIKRFGSSTLQYIYDDANNKVTVASKIDKPGSDYRYKRTEYSFDGFYRVSKTKAFTSANAADSSLVFYNFIDQKAKTVDAAGHWTEFSYDTLGYLMQTRNVDSSLSYNALAYTNSLSSYFGGTYTGFIEKRKYTDETGREFYKYFDAVGNLLREEKFAAGDGAGNIQQSDNPFNPDTTFTGQSRPSLITLTTDYQYDLLYRLKKVKTPEGKTIEYLYDLYGRQSQRMTPDAGMTKYSYDVKGNLILSQDANQKAIIYNLFTGRTYDGLNRLLTISDVKLPGVHDPSGSGPGGSGDTTLPSEFDFPSSADSLYVINAYDSLGLSPFASLFNSNKPYNFYTSAANNTKGMLTATAFRTNILDPWNFKFYRYDARGRVIKFWQKLAGMDSMKTMEYRYNGLNQAENLSYQPARGDWKFFKFKYDDAGRLDKAGFWAFNGTVGIGTNNDSFEVPNEELVDNNQGWTFTPYVDYSYNKNQQIDTLLLNATSSPLVFRHSYNNRNWLQGFYRPQSVGVFGYSLYYNPNGNIEHQNFVGSYINSFGDQTGLIHTYTYDNSNRMVKADRTGYADSSHDIIMGYDKDGNIKKMKRFGSANNLADNFSYEYFSGTNKLKKVTGSNDQYVYDANGNVIADSLKQNYLIKYDWRNLITELRRWQAVPGGGDVPEKWAFKITYQYDEAGNRICKKMAQWYSNAMPEPVEDLAEIIDEGDNPTGNWEVIETLYYIRDIAGKEVAIYNGNSVDQWNLYGSDQVGDIKSNGDKFFYLKDHLGTVRVVLDSTNALVSADDYDAWGYPLENRFSTSNTSQKYRFTSKERDKESSSDGIGYDYFGARYYDSRIGRWGGVEPLLDKYLNITPYNYSICNPVIAKDVNGLDVIVVFSGWGLHKAGSEISPNDYSPTSSTGAAQLLYGIQDYVTSNHLSDVDFKGYYSSVGFVSEKSEIEKAYTFITENLETTDEKVVLYGYSQGGSNIIELAQLLKDNGINVELLLTVDAYDGTTEEGSFEIPENVKYNYNYFQFKPGKYFGARGSGNTSKSEKTKIRNKIYKDSNHEEIDEDTNDDVFSRIKNVVN